MIGNKDIILINRYLDKDLSKEEIMEFENRLKEERELGSELEKYTRIKLQLEKIKIPPSGEYFSEDILRNKIMTGKENKIRKFIPVFGIVLLTAALAVFFKYNINGVDLFVENQKSNLVAYYSSNVKPLFVKTEINNDDVFLFAFNHIIPVDREKNQYLRIGYDQNGKDYFEINDKVEAEKLVTKQTFFQSLKLDQEQQNKIDQILDKYKSQIENQVVLSENNAIGVSQGLWALNKLIAAEVLEYAQKANDLEYSKLIPASYSHVSDNDIKKLSTVALNVPNSNYYFLTPDTIFNTIININVDKEKLNNKKEKDYKIQIQFDSTSKIYKNKKFHNFEVNIDDEGLKVEIPEIPDMPDIPAIRFQDIDSILKKIDKVQLKVLKNMKIHIPPITLPKNIDVWVEKLKDKKLFVDGDSTGKFEINLDGLDSLQGFDFKSLKNFKIPGLTFKFDSVHNKMNFQGDFNKEEFRKEMKKFKEAMKKWKKEFEKNKIEVEIE